MNYSEKITVNINVVDLGQIDLLVDKGLYSNRTDFIKTAIRNQIDAQDYILKDTIIKNDFALGVISYSRSNLEEKLLKKEKVNIKVVGMLVLGEDITAELAIETINSIEVKGIFKADQSLKEKLKHIIKNG